MTKQRYEHSHETMSGNVNDDVSMLKEAIKRWPGDVGVNVLHEMIILAHKTKKMAAVAEINWEMAYPIDITRVSDHWNKIFNILGYEFGTLNPEQVKYTKEGSLKRKFMIGDKVHKIPQIKKQTFTHWVHEFENILSSLDEQGKRDLLELGIAPDANYTHEEKIKMVEACPVSLQRMMDINSEKATSLILKKMLELIGQDEVDVESTFVDPEDPQKGYISHIKKKEK